MNESRFARRRARQAAGDETDALGHDLERAGRGDQTAFAAVYDALAPLVHGVVVRVVRNPSMAEEVTQEVFVELWRLAPRFDPTKGSPKSWAATVAHRRAVDRVRSEQAARHRDERDAATRNPGNQADTVAEAVVTRDEHGAVGEAMSQLTPTQREAVNLAYFEGHTYRQVAELLDVPEGTVKTRIRDGLIRLRQSLEVDL